MNPNNPFLSRDGDSTRLARRAANGDKDALETIIRRHQPWIHNIALRMVMHPDDAKDIAQEAMVRIITRIHQFEGRSSFRTWVYRIVKNCLLDSKRGQWEKMVTTFSQYGKELDLFPLEELAIDPKYNPEQQYILEEVKVSCMLGMLLCLEREQRLVYILGEVFECPSDVGGEILDVTPANFRQRLKRSRDDLYNFMNEKCGLINRENPCRCRKKTNGFIRAGLVNPANLMFAGPKVRHLAHTASQRSSQLDTFLESAYAEKFREHPFPSGGDLAETLKNLLEHPQVTSVFNLSTERQG